MYAKMRISSRSVDFGEDDFAYTLSYRVRNVLDGVNYSLTNIENTNDKCYKFIRSYGYMDLYSGYWLFRT